jgi:GPH family glycoside/pentoside/hexuronide:cation symporter
MRTGAFILFACGQLGVMALARFFFQWVLKFAGSTEPGSNVPLFAATAVGTLFLVFRIFDGVADPFAGIASDQWVARGRQRRSLLWFSFFLPSLGLALVFAPHAAMSEATRWALLGSGMFVFFLGYTICVIPYWSLIDDYSLGHVPTRAKLSNLLGAGVLVATGFGFVVSPILVEEIGYFRSAALWCVPCALLMLLPYYAAPKGGSTSRAATEHAMSLMSGLKLAFTHRRFLAVIILFAGGQMSFTVMTAAAPFIAINLLGGTTKDVAILLGPFLLTAVLGFLLVPRLTLRLGWEKAVLGATLLLGFAYGGAGFLGSAIVGSPITTAMLVFAVAGPMASVLLGLEGEAITASAAEHDAEVTSVYFGVYNFVVQILNGLAVLTTAMLADAIPIQGEVAVRGMGFSAGGMLVVGVVLYLAVRPPKSPVQTARSGSEA